MKNWTINGKQIMTIDSRKHYRITENFIMPASVKFATVSKDTRDEAGLYFALSRSESGLFHVTV